MTDLETSVQTEEKELLPGQPAKRRLFGKKEKKKKSPKQEIVEWILTLGAALVIALVVGALCQKGRMCMAGGIRDAIMFRDFKLLYGFAAIFVVTLIVTVYRFIVYHMPVLYEHPDFKDAH